MIFQSNSSDIERLKIQHQIQVDVAEKEITALKAEVKELRECLEFYADPEHWIKRDKHCWKRTSPKEHGDYIMILNYKHPNTDWIGTVEVGGKMATEILAKHKKEGEA